MDFHIGLTIPVHVHKGQRDGRQVLPIPDQGRAAVDERPGGVASGHLNDEHMPVQVQGDEMAGVRWAIVFALS